MHKVTFILFCGLFLLLGCESTEGASTPGATNEAVVTRLVDGGETAVSTLPAPQMGTVAAPHTPTPHSLTGSPTPESSADIEQEGALIAVTMSSRVGVLLDEIPAAMRDRVAESLLDETAEFWTAQAEQQVKLTTYRLNFRPFIRAGKGQLPLPPPELWQITLDSSGPQRQTIDEHDLVLINYEFSSTLLSDAVSPLKAEPALSDVGGVWNEPFILPLDPDLLLQRTGNACLNEAGFPPNSYDSENVFLFYDHACTAGSGGAVGCHRSQLPNFSCVEMLDFRVGKIATELRFERLEWDDELANSVRVGPMGADNTAISSSTPLI